MDEGPGAPSPWQQMPTLRVPSESVLREQRIYLGKENRQEARDLVKPSFARPWEDVLLPCAAAQPLVNMRLCTSQR